MTTASRPAAAVAREIDLRVEAELTRLLYRQAGFGLFSNFVLALIMAAALWRFMPARVSLGWLAVALAVSFFRLGSNL
ncbi:MAG: hypothetical protein ACHQ5A_14110, partial [Opitutales bacterium]